MAVYNFKNLFVRKIPPGQKYLIQHRQRLKQKAAGYYYFEWFFGPEISNREDIGPESCACDYSGWIAFKP